MTLTLRLKMGIMIFDIILKFKFTSFIITIFYLFNIKYFNYITS